MNIKDLTPAIAIHAGEYLADELAAREMTQQEFAALIGMNKSQLNEIIKGKRGINAELSILIGEALKMEPEIWLNLQLQYELDKARVDEKVQERQTAIEVFNRLVKGNVPFQFLKKLGRLSGDPLFDIPKVKEIYGVSSLEGLASVFSKPAYRFRQSVKLQVDQVNLVGWVKMAEYMAKEVAVPAFNHTQQDSVMKRLRNAIQKNSNLKENVRLILADAGIKLVYLENPPKTPVDGISFWSEGSPAIGMTLRHKRIDNFAFTLFHELGHVYMHLVNNNEAEFIDLTSDEKESKEEREADLFAQNYLIERAAYLRFKETSHILDDEAV
ncbi:HigA family addiction module antitoxin [Rufibacter quisquiliarum]|uniref:HTH-type transcriptional regulator/antitoxin HigA n=1 Tax=Rufibacter quisquiliarum TaxID=1549639 RepID=A0A839GMF0_9BACT|nr:HigA family addiction module antitoxin [Rufibacter quisquiliarum]MBA9076107.1 HTH-type transcriptional regulator/antitoxin HigA [Rufibacter quisquiliarum]